MAIAFDNASTIQTAAAATSLTYSKTNTGSNLYLVVSVNLSDTVDRISTVTYAGTAMTQIQKRVGSGSTTYIYGLAAPASGANNVVISTDGTSVNIRSCASSYTGAQQTTTPDASAQGDIITGGGDANLSITTVATNCWLIATNADSTLDPDAAATDSTVRAALFDTTIFDSGPKGTPGANNVGLHFTGSNTMTAVGLSIAPVVVSSFIPRFRIL